MKVKYPIFVTLVVLLAAGCATSSSKRKSADVKIVSKPNAYYRISGVGLYGDGGESVISGYLEPSYRPSHKGGHVDITILNSEGNVLESLKVDPDVDVSNKSLRATKGMRRPSKSGETVFYAVTDLDVPERAEIRLRYHLSSIQQCSD